ncbi:MAG: Hsp70 family protein [Anaerolineae bacterium]|nr:Hsp70 family protein [Anaerolineae bacterium]
MITLGIDFGTTNSSVAYYDGNKLQPILLDPSNENPNVLPSLIWIDRDYKTRIGTNAATEYLERETERRILWSRREIGAIEIIVAGGGSSPIHYWQDVHIVTDINANGRLLQSVKTVLRDPRYEGTMIFDRYYTVDELIALILTEMKNRAEYQLEQTCNSVVIGRPVRFSDDPAITERAEELIFRAARFAGFENISFQMEPVGAAHLYHKQTDKREKVLIFDFGGGTLDLTVAEVGGKTPPYLIASQGCLIGGDDLDRRIMQSLLKYFGKDTKVDGNVDFPPEYLDQLLTWQTMPELSRPAPLSRIKHFQETSSAPHTMYALETLVTRNVGYKLFHDIEKSKKQLTADLLTELTFTYEHIDIKERILRRSFNELISHEIKGVQRAVVDVLDESHLNPGDIDSVLRTGGTSLVPAFVYLLETLFGHTKVHEFDPLTSVVGGMAIVAQEGQNKPPAYAARYENPIMYIKSTSGRHYEHVIWRARCHCYTDREYTIRNLPLELSGLHGIRTADLDYESDADRLIRFRLRRPCQVYVIYQAKAHALPKWLTGFTRLEHLQVDIDSPGGLYPFFVYSRNFTAGAFAIGGPRAKGYSGIVFMNYLVACKPV